MRRLGLQFGLLTAAIVVSLLAVAAFAAGRPATADAHPLGNFTINRYSRIDLYSDAVRVHYVLDMAEIPAFQEMSAIDRDGDGRVSDLEKETYAADKAAELRDGLRLIANGKAVELEALSRELSLPTGQAGLKTLRLSLLLEGRPSGEALSVSYSDENYADRLGWKEIVVRPARGVELLQSSAPSEDVTDALTQYPDSLLSSPLDVTEASFKFVPGPGASAPAPAPSEAVKEPARERAAGGFPSLITVDELSLPVLLVAVFTALGFGALHALEPGHGKTFVAAYFVGVKGTGRQALLLGAIVAATHTAGVLAIALVTLYGSKFILPENLYPWLSLLSALIVVGLGVRLLFLRLSSIRPGMQLRGHAHGKDGGHTHSAAAEDGSPLPWLSLFWLGLADGLTPSPSALIVLLAAISLDRIGLGLLLIVAFSVGLAAVLAGVSLSLVYSRRLLDRLNARGKSINLLGGGGPAGRLLELLPVGGGLVLVIVGLALAMRALSQPGLLSV